MKIRYLGTGAAEGIPAMFCNCDFCNQVRKLGEEHFRTRTQVLINGELSVDFPPEAYAHSLKFGVNLSSLKYLLVTHTHMDHFYAHDFILRGYKYATLDEPVLEIYGNSEVKKVFEECTARELKPEVAPHVKVITVKPYEEFFVGGYRVLTIPANHGKTEDALLYYIEHGGKGYLHFYDTGPVDQKVLEFLAKRGAKADVVSFDCTFLDVKALPEARHMGAEDCFYYKTKLQELGVLSDKTKVIITHFSHNGKPTSERLSALEEQYGVIAAYDGLELEV